MLCNDPFITYLKSFGYNVIRLPKADVRPLQIMARQGNDLNRLGDLASLLVSGSAASLPLVTPDGRTANISGQRTSNLSIGVGLTILASVIAAMGGSRVGLDTKYQNAKFAAFEFQDVFENRIEIVNLDQFLADADINPLSHYVAEMLEADELYVTTATIKSTKFTVEATRSDGAALELNIPEIQGVVGSNVKVSGSAAVTSKITYESPVPLVFGFQAIRLFYDQGHYTAYEPVGPGGLGMRAPMAATLKEAQRLMAEGTFIRLADI